MTRADAVHFVAGFGCSRENSGREQSRPLCFLAGRSSSVARLRFDKLTAAGAAATHCANCFQILMGPDKSLGDGGVPRK